MRQGFTLIELLVVIAIIAALAAVVAPSVFRNVGDAKTVSARSQIEIFRLALTQYRSDLSEFPTTEQGLEALRSEPASLTNDALAWRGPYLSRVVPLDPWGRPYRYQSPGIADSLGYDLYTLGRDNRVGGSGEDEDVTSWGGSIPEGYSKQAARLQ